MNVVSSDALPKAIPHPVKSSGGVPGLLWIVACLAIALAVYAVSASQKKSGIEITINFNDGEGLSVGDPLRHRGVVVGEIVEIKLNDELEGVVVKAQIEPSSAQIATKGTRFWIVKAEASLKGVTGLETILSGQYIAVDPSRRKAEASYSFDGLSAPPAVQLPGDALEIVLEAENAGGLQASAPILFRGLEVGRIQSIGLSPDSRWVRMYASINADYSSLVRDNSVFWNRSGLKMNMGFTGFDLQTNTLSGLTVGGVEFATPEPPGTAVAIGHRFELHAEPEEEWREWKTSIATGPGLRLDMQALPAMQQAALRWKTSFYGIKRSQQRIGWVLLLSDGTLMGPSDLLRAPEDALPDTITFECAGKSWPIVDIKLRSSAQSSALRVILPELPGGLESWPIDRVTESGLDTIREGDELLLCEGNQRYVPLERRAFSITSDGIVLNNKAELPKPVHGSTLLSLTKKSIVGIVVANDETNSFEVIPIPN